MRLIISLFLISAIFTGCASNDYQKVFKLEARNYAMINAPVYAWIEDMKFDHNAMLCLYLGDEAFPGQVETLNDSRQRIWWIANLETGDSARYELRLNDGSREEEYQSEKYMWERITEHSTCLFVGATPNPVTFISPDQRYPVPQIRRFNCDYLSGQALRRQPLRV